MGLGAHGRSARALGAGVRAVEGRLDREVGRGAAANAVHADQAAGDDAARREGLVRVRARAVHEGKSARRVGGRRIFESAQRLFDAAAGADVHGGPRAAHGVRQCREPADRARLHAAEGDRGAPFTGRLARTARAPDADREPRAVGDRRCRRRRARRRTHAGPAGVRAV